MQFLWGNVGSVGPGDGAMLKRESFEVFRVGKGQEDGPVVQVSAEVNRLAKFIVKAKTYPVPTCIVRFDDLYDFGCHNLNSNQRWDFFKGPPDAGKFPIFFELFIMHIDPFS